MLHDRCEVCGAIRGTPGGRTRFYVPVEGTEVRLKYKTHGWVLPTGERSSRCPGKEEKP